MHTDDFPLLLNRKFYDYLIENFKTIEQDYSQLENDLNSEIENRIEADNRERSARQNEDNNLQGQINSLRQRMDTAEGNISNLQSRMTTAEEHIKKLDEIIFGTEYINDTEEIPLDDSMTPGNDVEVNDTETVNDDKSEVRAPDHDVLTDEVN